MGSSLSWVAVRGQQEVVHKELGLRGTGRREEVQESEITGAVLPGGWYLVGSNRDGLQLTEDALLERLSRIDEVVVCFVEEHVMFSFAACWRNGQRLWSISHDAQRGIDDLLVDGQPPDSFAGIRDRYREEQKAAGGKKAEVDYIFEVPVDLAEEMTGYRHDQEIPAMGKDPYEILELIRPPKQKRWWQCFKRA